MRPLPLPVDSSATIDGVVREHAAALGGDAAAYRNHVYRVANLCAVFALRDPLRPEDADALEKTAVAAVFHDLGIWTDGTFDYLPPSIRLAQSHLERSRRAGWVPEVAAMIREHHKLTRDRGAAGPLVEAFRRADWMDVSLGVRRFGAPRRLLRELYERWPVSGFHWRLVQLTFARLRTHPRSPLPMVRW